MQRLKKCALAGSTIGLNAGSHPSGTRFLVSTGELLLFEWCRGAIARGSRSPLLIRLTTTTLTSFALFAMLVVVTAVIPPAAKELKITAAQTALKLCLRKRMTLSLFSDFFAKSEPAPRARCG
jgi:hypothetical protein